MERNRVRNKGWGELIGDIFYKKVSRRKHFMRNLLAWGMDVAVCDDEVKRAKAIVLMDEDTSFYYIAFTDEFFAKSFKKNFGFGDQLFLGLKYWKIAHEVSDIAEIVAEHYRDKTQPQLFDEAV